MADKIDRNGLLKMSASAKELIPELYAQGLAVKAIASQVGVSRQRVYQILRELGMHVGRAPVPDDLKLEIKQAQEAVSQLETGLWEARAARNSLLRSANNNGTAGYKLAALTGLALSSVQSILKGGE